ncbi:CAP domain-containing protein [Demequina sp. NBRC 110057]|uniref:CAP domain-containing protein n=1 Tax=Demequina sp. NBRC 110057 TaxID=1570346 RepID=UPI00117882A7|nr:CAP domain-containing protein [Demequina sp. NBRC 110057]
MPSTAPRRTLATLAATVLAFALAATAAVPAHAATVTEGQGRTAITAGTNKHRVANQVSQLRTSAAMDKVAQDWAKALASSGSLRHNPKYSSQIPSGWKSAGENVAYNCGYSAPATTMVGQWKRSAGHNKNMLNRGFTHIGVGFATDKYGCAWGVQVFAGYASSKTLAASVQAQSFTSTAAPVVKGTRKVGSTLTASVPAWKPSPSFTYEWRRDGKKISGAAGKSYVLRAADKGHRISVKVTGKKSGYISKARVSQSTGSIR